MKTAEFVEGIIRAIAGRPENVVVEQRIDEMGVLVTIRVDREDMGRVLGIRGEHIQCIRHLAHAFGYRNRQKISIKLLEPGQTQ